MSQTTLDKVNDFTLGAKQPFPGPYAFRENDKDYFYGREKETHELCERIQKNILTVVFGKSGIGKTSLLQAGLIPELKRNYFFPIYMQPRFDENNKRSPLEQVKLFIEKELKESDEKSTSFDDLTLWEYFHRVQLFGGWVKPLLIIDQFEEMFKIGKQYPEKISPLIVEIGDLIQDWMPVAVQEKYEDKIIPYPVNEMDYRVVISLREDYLPQLMNLNHWMPSVVNGRFHFRISYMKGENALQAVLEPGREIIKDKDTAIEIIKKIPESKDIDYIPYEIQEGSWESKRIEPFLLSLISYRVNEKRIRENIDEISSGLLSGITIKDIVRDYYEETIGTLERGYDARIAIEEELLTPEGERKLQAIDSIRKEYDFNKNDIETLVDKRIIRREIRNNVDYIELIHDEFARILTEVRDKRREEEIWINESKEKKKKARARAIRIVGIILLILIGIIFGLWRNADKQYRNAEVSRLTAEALLEFPQDNTSAIRIAEAAYKKAQSTPPTRTKKTLSDIAYSSFERPFYITNLRHNGAIYSAVFSPDGRRILTSSEDGTAKVWDLEGRALTEVKHDARIMSAVFSPDGSLILTASWDNSVKLWDIKGTLKSNLRHNGIVSAAAFSPDGQRILTASRDGKARIWDLDGNVLAILPYDKVISSAVFSNDGQQLLTASWDKTVKMWNVNNNNGNPLLDIKHKSTIASAVFSPDGQYILSALEQGAVYLWNLEGKLLLEREVKEGVSSVVFSPDGKGICTVSRNGTVKLWNLAGKLLSEFKYNAPLYSAAFSPDGRLLVTASEDGTAKVWGLQNNIVKNLDEQKADMKIAIYSPDGSLIFTSALDGTSKLWTSDGVFLHQLENKRMLSSAVFSPDGQQILTTSQTPTARLWNLEGQELDSPINSGDPDILLSSAVFSPDGKQIIITSRGVKVRRWDLERKCMEDLIKADEPISSAVFSPDSKCILIVSTDNAAKLLTLKGELLDEFRHNKEVSSAVFSPDGKKILTASADGTAKLWSYDGETLLELRHKSVVSSAVFSPDGRRILTASDDHTAKLWDLRANLLADLDKHTDVVNSAVFSPDGRQVITASRDGTVKIWLTPGAIFDWLKKANISPLTEEEKRKLEIQNVK
ncbi:MAG: hypothetical protein NT166_01895 [Candidatus Aminicenantes bacterium]|nr:hypothetical protein [Candidatus Aminicenantes bacterium]